MLNLKCFKSLSYSLYLEIHIIKFNNIGWFGNLFYKSQLEILWITESCFKNYRKNNLIFFYQSKLVIIIPALVRSFIISLIRQLYMDDWDLLNDTFLEVWLLIDTFLQGWPENEE